MDSPGEFIGEVTLIGTGGGYGESNVVHLGNGEWMVIDSCINPKTKNCLPLEYLIKIGVNVESQVKIIICSHWHNDHIMGMHELLIACKSADFFFARCTDKDKFITFIEIDAGKHFDTDISSSTFEFFKCLNLLSERESIPKRAIIDRLLYSSNKNGVKAEVVSVSPSDETLSEFDKEIAGMIEIVKQRNKKFVDKSPNDKSVVIYIKLNDHRIILGADLEVTSSKNAGWHNILTNVKSIDSKATLFKLPHHGSKNGYLEDVWKELVESNSIATITPYNRGAILPQIEMLKQYSTHTDNIYLTTNTMTMGSKAKSRERSLENMIKEQNSTLREVKYRDGMIRCRISIKESSDDWDVATFGEAINAKVLLK